MNNHSKIALLLALISVFSIMLVPAALGIIADPTNLTTTTVTFDSITLNWTDNANNEQYYYVERYNDTNQAWDLLASDLAHNTTSYTDTGLAEGTTYQYRVYAGASLDNVWDYSGVSNTASGTTMAHVAVITTPAAPTNLAAVAVSSSMIDLAWSDNATNENGYRVERQESGIGSWTPLATLAADSSSYSDNSVTAGKSYDYQVVAYNLSGDSPFSNIASATTPSPATPLTMVMKFFLGSTQYTVDGVLQTMDAAPIEQFSRMLLPIRYVVEPLGITPVWDGISKVTIQNSTTTIELWLDQNTASVNGVDKLIDPDNPNVVPIAIPPGRVMLPLRFVSENLGCSAVWDPTPPGSATISYPGGP